MMIRIGIIGSRSIREKYKIYALLNKIFRRYPEAELVSGGAEGPDSFAYDYCIDYGHDIIVCGAGWKVHGKKAGFIRNMRIAKRADIIIAFWDEISGGTKHCMDYAKKMGKKVYKYDFKTDKLILYGA